MCVLRWFWRAEQATFTATLTPLVHDRGEALQSWKWDKSLDKDMFLNCRRLHQGTDLPFGVLGFSWQNITTSTRSEAGQAVMKNEMAPFLYGFSPYNLGGGT